MHWIIFVNIIFRSHVPICGCGLWCHMIVSFPDLYVWERDQSIAIAIPHCTAHVHVFLDMATVPVPGTRTQWGSYVEKHMHTRSIARDWTTRQHQTPHPQIYVYKSLCPKIDPPYSRNKTSSWCGLNLAPSRGEVKYCDKFQNDQTKLKKKESLLFSWETVMYRV